MTFSDDSTPSFATAEETARACPAAPPVLTNALARKYLVRVMAHARRIVRRLPPHITMGDLISAGMLGVVEGYQRFDAGRAETLEAFLDHRIRGAMLDEMRRHDPLTRVQRAFVRKHARAVRDAEQGGDATEEGVATAMGMSVGDVRQRADEASTARALQATGGAIGADEVPDADDAPDAALEARQHRALVAGAASGLSAREQEMLALHYEEGRTLREIGVRFGVTESRVSQLHAQAIRRMRAAIAA